jgi:YidC/Oxa1 family membrane protein insertase
MEQKKFDLNSIIGFALIFVIILWMMYNNRENEVKEQAKAKTEIAADKKAKATTTKEVANTIKDTTVADSVKMQKLQGSLGSFTYSATLPSAKEDFTTIENELIKLKIANKGGFIAEATLKNYKKIDKNSNELVALIKNNNVNFNLQLQTKDNRVLNTKDLFFEPTVSKFLFGIQICLETKGVYARF